MAYRLEGTMLEACSCNAICPCWVGEDPDLGTCEGTIAWNFENGEIDGVDVSGLTFAVQAGRGNGGSGAYSHHYRGYEQLHHGHLPQQPDAGGSGALQHQGADR